LHIWYSKPIPHFNIIHKNTFSQPFKDSAPELNEHILTVCTVKNCEIIFVRWTFKFVYFMGWASHQFILHTNYFYNLVRLFNLQIHELKCTWTCPLSSNMKFSDHESKWFHSISDNINLYNYAYSDSLHHSVNDLVNTENVHTW